MMPPQTPEYTMRVSALLVYAVVAGWVAWEQSDTGWFVLHATGAVCALIAAHLVVTYAGLIGQATPGPVEDQGRTYMEMEDWDD